MRTSGILMHISSLPSAGGIGSLGPEAYAFADFLQASGMRIWQVLPVGPTGYGESPYQSSSVFAGNPLLISCVRLREEGLLTYSDQEEYQPDDPEKVNYDAVRSNKETLLRRCYDQSRESLSGQISEFIRDNPWVNDFALFTALKHHFGGVMWTKWPDADIRFRKPEAVKRYREELAQEIRDAETCRKFLARLGDPRLRLAVCSDFWFDPTNRGLQQVAILSRLPVRRAGFERWAAADFVYPPRGFSWAVIDVGPTNVAFFDVHLKSNYIPEDQDVERQTVLNRLKREIAARQLLARIDELAPGMPAVVAGDFNTALEDERFAEERTIRIFLDAGFRDAFEGIPEADRPTLPANDFYPPATFDHILVRGLPSPLARSVGADIRTSDHRPLRASFPLGEFAR